MYKSFEIKNFKCFEHLKLENLARVNLIAGKNSVGKSALLEALYLHCDGHNPRILYLLKRLSGYRRFGFGALHRVLGSRTRSSEPMDHQAVLSEFFRDFNVEDPIELRSTDGLHEERVFKIAMAPKGGEVSTFEPPPYETEAPAADEPDASTSYRDMAVEKRTVLLAESQEPSGVGRYELVSKGDEIEVVPRPPSHAVLAYRRGGIITFDQSEDAELFSKLVKQGREGFALEALKKLEPRLERLEVLIESGVALIHGQVRLRQPIPLAWMGDGVVRFADVLLLFTKTENGVVLLDEIENGLHYTVLEDVWRAIAEAARVFNVQVFATTHSFECIEAAHRAFRGEHANEFRLLRLERVKGKIRAFDYDPDVLEAAIQMNAEVR